MSRGLTLLTWVTWVGFRARVLPGQECLASPPPCSSASETRATGHLPTRWGFDAEPFSQ